MGLINRLFGFSSDAAQRVLPDPYEPFMGYGSIPVADPGVPLFALRDADVQEFWRTQPNVRKVIDFIARNVASIPLHVFDRVSDTDRKRVRDGALADVISQPKDRQGAYRFWHGVLSDGLLFDKWAVLKNPRPDGSLELLQIPSWRLRFVTNGLREVEAITFWVGSMLAEDGDVEGWRSLDLDALIFDHGYAPLSAGLSPIDTLRDVLDESAEAVRYRRQLWENGARTPAWIERPAEATWSLEARNKFAQSFRAAYTGDGENAGGVPLLEDGMKLHDMKSFTPQDAQDLEGRRLTAIEVAAAFHVAPELVGARQGNHASIDAFRQMLYRDSLGPYITAWEQSVNAMLTPDLVDGRNLYVEASIESKLRGSFQEQAQIMQSATGAPWLTRNEARSKQNLPRVEGGDELVVPLNVLIGGQASPNDSGTQNLRSGPVQLKSAGVRIKAVGREQDAKAAAAVVGKFFKRQRREVLSSLGSKDAEWWDEERWDDELTDDLLKLALRVSEEVAHETLDALGVEAGEYSVPQTKAFLLAVAAQRAKMINATTRGQVQAALDDDLGEDAEGSTPAGVFDLAESSRSEQAGMTLATTLAGFAVTEAVKQLNRPRTTKMWLVTSGNPRSSHAAMNGETVPIGSTFSNGAEWPGDSALDVDEVAGCQCGVEVTVG